MLELKNIYKSYMVGKEKLEVLKDVTTTFGEVGFVSILGPSGCGKTTLLNVIGGLDHYDTGDLIINKKSTKDFKDRDWDNYRNKEVGIVFQSYNLITYQSILSNVMLSLSLSGLSRSESKAQAIKALTAVGLEKEIYKKPNQLSGGQMQRVAIARAMVTNPSILLADEPTGALDSKTSIQILNLLKEISKTKLVIMVTHNTEMALEYSTRTILLFDGQITSDESHENSSEETAVAKAKTNDYTTVDESLTSTLVKSKLKNKTSMSFFTALKLSFSNLMLKKGRTILTSIAGSFGIIGIALILAISNGFQGYVNRMQSETLSSMPIVISKLVVDQNTMMNSMLPNTGDKIPEYPKDENISVYEPETIDMHQNDISSSYVDFVSHLKTMKGKNDDPILNSMKFDYGINMNVITKRDDGQYTKVYAEPKSFLSQSFGNSGDFKELAGDEEFMLSQYDLIGKNSKYPTKANEIVLVIDKNNRLTKSVAGALGITTGLNNYTFDDLIGKKYKVVPNNDFYTLTEQTKETLVFKDINRLIDLTPEELAEEINDLQFLAKNTENRKLTDYSPKDTYDSMFNDDKIGTDLVISGILRIKPETNLELLYPGLYFTKELTQQVLEDSVTSDIAEDLLHRVGPFFSSGGVLTSSMAYYSGFSKDGPIIGNNALSTFANDRLKFGTDRYVTGINIYASSFKNKEAVIEYLDDFNEGKELKDKVIYSDYASMITGTMGTMIDVITYVLVAFASISLVVSCVMIGIITYVSVVERTKEIGILRAIGARKKDVSSLFQSETFVIGLASGVFGVAVTYLLSLPINLILNSLFPTQMLGNIASLNPIAAIVLIIISIGLTFISGFLPSRMASKKDPVEALRTE